MTAFQRGSGSPSIQKVDRIPSAIICIVGIRAVLGKVKTEKQKDRLIAGNYLAQPQR